MTVWCSSGSQLVRLTHHGKFDVRIPGVDSPHCSGSSLAYGLSSTQKIQKYLKPEDPEVDGLAPKGADDFP